MWNRRDYLALATAAIATFGLTLATFYPRLANAVDQAPAPTTEVKTPTLALGTAQVTAARDDTDPKTIILTVKNTADQPTKVEFLAQVMESPSVATRSRIMIEPLPVWSQELSRDLKAGETQTIKVTLPAHLTETSTGQNAIAPNNTALKNVTPMTLPANALVLTKVGETQTLNVTLASSLAENSAARNQIAVDNSSARNIRLMTLPTRYLTLADKAQPKRSITALNLSATPTVIQVSAVTLKAPS